MDVMTFINLESRYKAGRVGDLMGASVGGGSEAARRKGPAGK